MLPDVRTSGGRRLLLSLAVVAAGGSFLVGCSTIRSNELCSDVIKRHVVDLLAAVDTPEAAQDVTVDPVACADSVDSAYSSKAFEASAPAGVALAVRTQLEGASWNVTAPAGGARYAFTRVEGGQRYWAQIYDNEPGQVYVSISAGSGPY